MLTENTLLKKLQLKPNFNVKVVNPPNNFDEIIGYQNEISFNSNTPNNTNALLIFAQNKVDLLNALKAEKIEPNTICWIFYPKAKSTLAGHLNLMHNYDDLKAFNLTPCRAAAIDNNWTALRIKPISAIKKSGLGNTEITKNDYGNYIDIANKIINLPHDLALELKQQPLAFNFYQELSYTNRKEYVLWVLSAKQEKTRTQRITKTIEKLVNKKKNPSEK